MVALKRALGVVGYADFAQAVNLGGLVQGPSKPATSMTSLEMYALI